MKPNTVIRQGLSSNHFYRVTPVPMIDSIKIEVCNWGNIRNGFQDIVVETIHFCNHSSLDPVYRQAQVDRWDATQYHCETIARVLVKI